MAQLSKKEIGTRVHFVGIGGIGMSGIAALLLRRGFTVSGSDLKEDGSAVELRNLGARIFTTHDAGNIGSAQALVYSSAIKDDNPEIIEAKKRGLVVLRRAEALAWLMKDKTVITVTGSHGKTTTTSLLAYLLSLAGLNPAAAIGGILKNIGTNTYSGSGEFFVAEADESDGTFLNYAPQYSIITNIDREHLDYYKNFENEQVIFKEFMSLTRPGGCLFCCADDPVLMSLVSEYKGRYRLFGLNAGADIYPKNIVREDFSSEFDCFLKGQKHLGRFRLSLAGTHNISNALSVIALAVELGIDNAVIKQALSTFKGAGRRIEVKFKNDDYLLIDDYAHHPTEIKATLQALKAIKSKRLIVIFQPHRYSRAQLLLEEFGKSFILADRIIVTDIYAASEPQIPGITGLVLAEKIRQDNLQKKAQYLPKDAIINHVLKIIEPGDTIVTLGAGDITKICDELAEELKRKN